MKARIFFLSILTIALFSTGCKKVKDTIALVRIVDVDGVRLSGVSVRLYPEPSEIQGQNELIEDVTQSTDGGGEAVFDFSEYYERGQSGFAVLNIEATKDTLTVMGIIKIEPEEVNEQTLILQ